MGGSLDKKDLTKNKKCVKYAPYLHQKKANWALNIVLLFYALVLNADVGHFFLNYGAKLATNLMKLVTNSTIFCTTTK